MKTPTGNDNSKRKYSEALLGAYFGIFNVFFVFIPYLTSLSENKLLLSVYSVIGIFILATIIPVPLLYRNEYNYQLSKLKYLLFLGVYTLTFYLGLTIYIYLNLNNSKSFANIYIMILYVVLSVMSAWDILSSANKGFSNIRRFYTRTFKKHIFYNILITLGGLALGILLILPQILL